VAVVGPVRCMRKAAKSINRKAKHLKIKKQKHIDRLVEVLWPQRLGRKHFYYTNFANSD